MREAIAGDGFQSQVELTSVMSGPSTGTDTGTAASPQQINVADLELPQLAEVKRQLEEVSSLLDLFSISPLTPPLGALTPHQLFCPTQAGPGQVPIVHRERKRSKTREQRYLSTYIRLRPAR
jgi:hypothetical protein